MVHSLIESFLRKSHFCLNFKMFWVVKNSFPIVEKLTKINRKKNAKTIPILEFSTLYISISHELLIKVLNETIVFFFHNEKMSRVQFSESSVYLTLKGAEEGLFKNQSLKE